MFMTTTSFTLLLLSKKTKQIQIRAFDFQVQFQKLQFHLSDLGFSVAQLISFICNEPNIPFFIMVNVHFYCL